MSTKWKVDGRDMKSAVRHTALPLLAGAGVAALQAAQAGSFDMTTLKGAAVTSVLAGVIRLLQRWCTVIQGASGS